MICPGSWRHSLALVDKAPVGQQRDEYGGLIYSDEQVSTEIGGELMPASSREVVAAQHRQIQKTHTFTTWYNPAITPGKYFSYVDQQTGVNRVFRITGITNVKEMGQYHKVDLKEDAGV